jgi:hypothetical protein
MPFELIELDDYRTSREEETSDLRQSIAVLDEMLRKCLGDAVRLSTQRDVHLARIRELETK